MGLFDILSNPEVRSVLTQLAGQAQQGLSKMGQMGQKAQDNFSNFSQKVPQGMGGLLGAGALGALLGGLMPRGGAQAAGMLGLGVLAWNFYKKWSQNGENTPQGLTSQNASGDLGPQSGAEAANDPSQNVKSNNVLRMVSCF
ncbi:MAG: hypothetical protein IJS50_02215 [Desulfovibrio sp.]|nr:hypothetical protein [Desulfovibrio sp.]